MLEGAGTRSVVPAAGMPPNANGITKITEMWCDHRRGRFGQCPRFETPVLVIAYGLTKARLT